MRDNFVITVTNNIEGCPIEKYLDSICANVVIGTNIFSDIAASFSDFFGGHSGSYKNKLELIYNEARKELKNKAIKLGANAIVGFSVDFDEISGGNKSMFMISASGTACVVKYPLREKESRSNDMISNELVDIELKKRYIVDQINKGASINPSWREFLYEHPQIGILNKLLDLYVRDCFSNFDSDKELTSFIERNISLLPKEEITEIIYERLLQNNKEISKLIGECRLFSPSLVLKLAQQDAHLAIGVLCCKKDYYTKEDLILMKQILEVLNSLPDTGKIEMIKGGLLSKDQEKFICENGHKNSKESEFCDTCNRNIKGLHRDEVEIIDSFQKKIDILSDFLNYH